MLDIIFPTMAGSQSLLAASSILAIIYLAFHYLKVRSKALDLPIYGKSQQDHYYDSISVGGKEVCSQTQHSTTS